MDRGVTLGDALRHEGNEEQARMCSDELLSMNGDQLAAALEGQDVGLSDEGKESFRKLCSARINNVQNVLPYEDVKLSSDAHPNW